ncbi:concanavalin A-like lectin/glucanase domain-containing protein [Clohesyomyces aquaticus]|uniref:endo-1,3(4)-beta-glucanase n=1 Tax=Clohesyomyces aquaticus TaxID=1231657 RepID=A0A1Y1ZD98_9PLEO|nr:concanavalin A-like lectin/glucanase domain-containing protein [Clohesyomyces aquaticus]
MYLSTFLSAATLFQLSIAGYVLEDDYMKDFYGNFEFFTDKDPTNGFVKFVDQATAESTGLINATSYGANSNAVSWGVDTTNNSPNGRSSIRLTSKKSYNNGLVVLDVEHMPTGCGTWPAFWMVGPSWPKNGEIDILEGVNEQEANAMTLHTGPGCSIAADSGAFAGEIATSNCDVNAANQDKNAGCSIHASNKNTYGAGLNANNGGVYATLWTDEAISIYFFPRGSIPDDVTGDSPNPAGWGKPAAKFAGDCHIPSIFKSQQIVFDTTFCGDWAGQVWDSSSCASKADTCNSFVQNNPSAFKEAYWTINALKVYQDNGQGPSPSSPVSSSRPSPSGITPPVVSSISAPNGTAVPSIGQPSLPFPVPTTLETSARFTGGRHTRSRHRFSSQTLAFDSVVPTLPAASASAPIPSVNATLPLAPKPTITEQFSVTSLAPVPTITASYSVTIPSPLSSGADIPTAVPGTPGSPARPSQGGKMSAFNWPHKKQTGAGSAVVSSEKASASGKPAAGSSAAASTRTPVVASPETTVVETVVAVPTRPVPIVTEVISSKVVQTVYETVLVTVPYPGETPAPAGRRARHVREHKRRHGAY